MEQGRELRTERLLLRPFVTADRRPCMPSE